MRIEIKLFELAIYKARAIFNYEAEIKDKTTEQENMNIRANGLTQAKNTKTTRAEICFNKILSVHFPLNSIYKAILPSLPCLFLARCICIKTHRRLKRIVASKQTTCLV